MEPDGGRSQRARARATRMRMHSMRMHRHACVSRKMENPDTELDLGAQDPDDPKFGNHWARRKADQVAQDTMEETETTPDLIDEYFGWNQKARKKKQQIQYRGKTGMLKLARITMML